MTLEGIKRIYINIEREEWKLGTLCDLYETLTITHVVIFLYSRCMEKMHSRDFTISAPYNKRKEISSQGNSDQGQAMF